MTPLTPEHHKHLACALAAIDAAKAGPTAEDLAAAPVLDLWRPIATAQAAAVLWGHASGHPRLADGPVVTSRLIALDRTGGWARTISRWYVLALPFSTFEAGVARSATMAESAKGIISFELPGYVPVDDTDLLDRLLAAYITRVRMLEADVHDHL